MGNWVSAAGDAVQGVGSFMGSQAQASALKAEATAAEQAGKQDQTARLTELQKTIGAITAMSAQRSVDPNSPSIQAYIGGVQKETYSAIGQTRMNASAQSRALRKSASSALTGGYIALGSSLLKATGKGLDSSKG